MNSGPAQTKNRDEDGVEDGLFEHLRAVRREIAKERGVPAFVILHDLTLLELARLRPANASALRRVAGIGERKMADFGERLIEVIIAFSVSRTSRRPNDPSTDAAPGISLAKRPQRTERSRQFAFRLFARGSSVEKVSAELGIPRSVAFGYLQSYIRYEKPVSVRQWIDLEPDAKMNDEEVRIILHHVAVKIHTKPQNGETLDSQVG